MNRSASSYRGGESRLEWLRTRQICTSGYCGGKTEPFNAIQKLARRHAITIARSSGVFAALKSAV
jgi:hypothetical protein